MAKVQHNAVVKGISGAIGDLVFRQMPDGSTYISGKQDFSQRKFSQGQKDHQSRFRQAAWYGRNAARSQPIYAQLAKGTGKSPYNFAVSDWWHAPVIHQIERDGETIRIQASDDVMVVSVQVMILDEQGVEVEKGEGRKCQVSGATCQEDWWEYTPGVTGRVVVEVRDLAGNVVRAESSE